MGILRRRVFNLRILRDKSAAQKSLRRQLRSAGLLLVAALFPAALGADAPVVNYGGVLNAASYAADGVPNSGVAAGSMFVIFGSNLSGPGIHSARSYPLPLVLEGTSARVVIHGVTVKVVLVYTSPGQVGAILPSSTPAGSGVVIVNYNGVDSATAPIQVKPVQFGIFTRNSAGSGPAIVQNVNEDGSQPLNSLTQSLRPDQLAVLWGTGLGPVTGDEAAGPLPGDLNTNLTVLVGNQPAAVRYRGRSGCCAGVDEIVFQVPRGITGCYVPLAVRIGDTVSNFASISVAPAGGICSDPHGLSTADFKDVAQGNDLRIGSVELFRGTFNLRMYGLTTSFTQDVGAAGFYRFDRIAAPAEDGLVGVVVRGFSGMAPFGSCNVYPMPDGDLSSVSDTMKPGALGAGSLLNLSGSGGAKSMTETDAGIYNAQLGGAGALDFAGEGGSGGPPYLNPGVFEVDNGAGGSDVGPFQASITIPPAIVWTNAEQITSIDRTKDLTLNWTGGDPTKEFIIIAGTSVGNFVYDTGASVGNGALFVCTERADARSFTIPAQVLSALPAGDTSPDATGLSGLLFIGNVSLLGQNRIQARGLSAGFLYYLLFQFENVTFQ